MIKRDTVSDPTNALRINAVSTNTDKEALIIPTKHEIKKYISNNMRCDENTQKMQRQNTEQNDQTTNIWDGIK